MERIRKKVSAFTVIEIILIVILALIMITMLVFNFMFKDKNSAASLFGYSFFNTKSFEMMRDIPKNTLIIAKESEKENVKEGLHTALFCGRRLCSPLQNREQYRSYESEQHTGRSRKNILCGKI